MMESYGFEEPEFVPGETFEEFKASYAVVLNRRFERWKLVIDQGHLIRGSKLKRFCRKGVPCEFRAHVWMTLSGAYDEMKQNPDVYKTAVNIQPPKHVSTIIMADLPRTFPENKFFVNTSDDTSKLLSLQRILIAFAVTFPDIGYCQGLNYVAATLLLALANGPQEEIEEKVFWLLHALTHRIVPNYYIRGMVDVQVDCLVFEELLNDKDNDLGSKVHSVYRILKNANVDCIVLATKWFICLFADVVPIETVLRIFDCLFYEGDKIIFRACIALVKLHYTAIVTCQLFPDVVLTFRNITQDKHTLYCHEFLKAMFSLPGSLPRSRITGLRALCLKRVRATMEDLDQREREYQNKQAKLEAANGSAKLADGCDDEVEVEKESLAGTLNEENSRPVIDASLHSPVIRSTAAAP